MAATSSVKTAGAAGRLVGVYPILCQGMSDRRYDVVGSSESDPRYCQSFFLARMIGIHRTRADQ